jgi:hypothetical protein
MRIVIAQALAEITRFARSIQHMEDAVVAQFEAGLRRAQPERFEPS